MANHRPPNLDALLTGEVSIRAIDPQDMPPGRPVRTLGDVRREAALGRGQITGPDGNQYSVDLSHFADEPDDRAVTVGFRLKDDDLRGKPLKAALAEMRHRLGLTP